MRAKNAKTLNKTIKLTMQNKGIVKFIAIVLILVCCFYLSFTFVTRHYESKAAAMGEKAGQEYLDSINNEKVYMGVLLPASTN